MSLTVLQWMLIRNEVSVRINRLVCDVIWTLLVCVIDCDWSRESMSCSVAISVCFYFKMHSRRMVQGKASLKCAMAARSDHTASVCLAGPLHLGAGWAFAHRSQSVPCVLERVCECATPKRTEEQAMSSGRLSTEQMYAQRIRRRR